MAIPMDYWDSPYHTIGNGTAYNMNLVNDKDLCEPLSLKLRSVGSLYRRGSVLSIAFAVALFFNGVMFLYPIFNPYNSLPLVYRAIGLVPASLIAAFIIYLLKVGASQWSYANHCTEQLNVLALRKVALLKR